MNRGRTAPLAARPTFQRRFQLPDRCIARTPDRIERQARTAFAAMAFNLKPSLTAIDALADGWRAGLFNFSSVLNSIIDDIFRVFSTEMGLLAEDLTYSATPAFKGLQNYIITSLKWTCNVHDQLRNLSPSSS